MFINSQIMKALCIYLGSNTTTIQIIVNICSIFLGKKIWILSLSCFINLLKYKYSFSSVTYGTTCLKHYIYLQL